MDHSSAQNSASFEEASQIIQGQERRDTICQLLSSRNTFFDGLLSFLLYLPNVTTDDIMNQQTELFLRTSTQLITSFLKSDNFNLNQNQIILLYKHLMFVKPLIPRDSFLHSYLKHLMVSFGLGAGEDPQLSYSMVDKTRMGGMSSDQQISNINSYLADSMESNHQQASMYLSSGSGSAAPGMRAQTNFNPSTEQMNKFLNLNAQSAGMNQNEERISMMSSSMGNLNYPVGNMNIREMLQLQQQQNNENMLIQQNYINAMASVGSQHQKYNLSRQNVEQSGDSVSLAAVAAASGIMNQKQSSDIQNSLHDTRLLHHKAHGVQTMDNISIGSVTSPSKGHGDVGGMDDSRNMRILSGQAQNSDQINLNFILQQRQQQASARMMQIQNLAQAQRLPQNIRNSAEGLFQLSTSTNQGSGFQGRFGGMNPQFGGPQITLQNNEQMQISSIANNQQLAILHQQQQQLIQMAQLKHAAAMAQQQNAGQAGRTMQVNNNDSSVMSSSVQLNEMLKSQYFGTPQPNVTNEAILRQLHQNQLRRISELSSTNPGNLQLNELLQRENLQRQIQMATVGSSDTSSQNRIQNSGNLVNVLNHQILQGELADPNNPRAIVDTIQENPNQLSSLNIQNLQRSNLLNPVNPSTSLGNLQNSASHIQNMNMYSNQIPLKSNDHNASSMAAVMKHQTMGNQLNSNSGSILQNVTNFSPSFLSQHIRGSLTSSEDGGNVTRTSNPAYHAAINRELLKDPNWHDPSRSILMNQANATPTGSSLDFNLVSINSPDLILQQQQRAKKMATNLMNPEQFEQSAMYVNQMNAATIRMMNAVNRQNLAPASIDSTNRQLMTSRNPNLISSASELQRFSASNNPSIGGGGGEGGYDASTHNLISMIKTTNSFQSTPSSNSFFSSGAIQSGSSSIGSSQEDSHLSQETIRKITDPRFLERIKKECPDQDDSATIMLKIPSGVILPLSQLKQTNSQQTFSFEVPETAYNSIIDTSCMEVTMVITNGLDEIVRWPNKVHITFNGTVFDSVSRDSEYGDFPLMLKRYMISGLNHLSISFQNDSGDDPYVMLILVMNMPLSLVIPRLVHKRLMLTEWCLKENTIYINRQIDALSRKYQDRECNSMLLSLICPVKKDIIMIPAKGENCFHIECFDLVTLLRACHLRRVFYCPICKQLSSMENLKIDSFVWNILTEIENSNTSMVRISRDLKWTPHSHLDNHHPPLSPSDMIRLMKSIKDEILSLGAVMTVSDTQSSIDSKIKQSASTISMPQSYIESKNELTSLSDYLGDSSKGSTLRSSISSEIVSSYEHSAATSEASSSPMSAHSQYHTPKKGRVTKKKAHKQLSRSFDNVSSNSPNNSFIDEAELETSSGANILRQRFTNSSVRHNVSPYEMPSSPNTSSGASMNKRLNFGQNLGLTTSSCNLLSSSSSRVQSQQSLICEKLPSESELRTVRSGYQREILNSDNFDGFSLKDVEGMFDNFDFSTIDPNNSSTNILTVDSSNQNSDPSVTTLPSSISVSNCPGNSDENVQNELETSYFEFRPSQESNNPDFTNVLRCLKQNVFVVDSKSLPPSSSASSMTTDERESSCDPSTRVPLDLANNDDIFAPFTSSASHISNIPMDYSNQETNLEEYSLKTSSTISDAPRSNFRVDSPSASQSNPSSTHPELDNFLQEIMCLSNENTDFLFSVDVEEVSQGEGDRGSSGYQNDNKPQSSNNPENTSDSRS